VSDPPESFPQTGSPPVLTAVVVAYDSAHALPECLAALRREGVPAIVVDNASADGSAAIAREAGAKLVAMRSNEGFGRAMNAGVRAAESELCLLVNPDLVLEEGAAAALVEAARLYPDAGLLAPRLVEPGGRFFFQRRSLLAPYLRNEKNRPCVPEGDCCAPFLSGAALVVRREPFLAMGGFDNRIFLFYEDDDLCRRVADAGLGLVHVHAAVARHGRGRSTAAKPGRVLRARWHLAWSRCYVSRKYGLGNPALRLVLAHLPRAVLGFVLGRRKMFERHGGTVAGALAFMRGLDAFDEKGAAR
jgi:N-acetylglucosaminyl-diphospho-decaprenol L-rhamnosyltransferase